MLISEQQMRELPIRTANAENRVFQGLVSSRNLFNLANNKLASHLFRGTAVKLRA